MRDLMTLYDFEGYNLLSNRLILNKILLPQLLIFSDFICLVLVN